MDKKLVIWFIGSNSVGKTTQARVFHSFFSKYCPKGATPEIVEWIQEDKKIAYTKMNAISSNLGRLTKRQCSGTDTLNSKFQIQTAYEAALKSSQVVIVEGIMATGKWVDFLTGPNIVLWTILLDVSEDTNFLRLKQRRARKRGVSPDDIEIAPKTQENLSSKVRGFRSLYARAKEYSRYHTHLFTDEMGMAEVSKLLKKALKDVITESF